MSKGLLNSFKNGTIPETVKNTEENIKEEVVATPVEPAIEESELDKLKRELAEARKKAEEAEETTQQVQTMADADRQPATAAEKFG